MLPTKLFEKAGLDNVISAFAGTNRGLATVLCSALVNDFNSIFHWVFVTGWTISNFPAFENTRTTSF